MKARRYRRQYILDIFKNRRGAGFFPVYAHTTKQARKMGEQIIGKRPFTVEGVRTRRQWDRDVRDSACGIFLMKRLAKL